jgi:ribonucleoside-diphosphate reductase alpha chain
MVAAVQPLVSGGVSKTVNLPSGATTDDIVGVFDEAWRCGLKAVAVYRQGSKLMQPLVTPDV